MSQSSMTADELRKKISDWISDRSNHENDLIDFLIDDCGCELREEEEDVVCVGCNEFVCKSNEEPKHKDNRDEAVCVDCYVCDDCEGKCLSDETSSCDECGIELRNGCANNPSDHSIFDGCCDNCRSFEETDCLCGNNKEKGWLNKVGGDMICEDCDIGGCNQMITEEEREEEPKKRFVFRKKSP